MLTFFCGRQDKVLETLQDPYSHSYEKLVHRKSVVVDMSRWVSLDALERLLVDVAELSGRQIPSLATSLSDQGWSQDRGGQRVTCVVLADRWLESVSGVTPTIATQAAAQWAGHLGPPVDQFTRGALRIRAEQLFALLHHRKKPDKIVLMEEGNELPVQFTPETEQESDVAEASSASDMAFFAGDAEKIGSAFEDVHDRSLRRGVVKSADFSFHLVLEDLDELARIAAEIDGKAPLRLSDSIERCVAGDAKRPWAEREWSADVLKADWVDLWTALSSDQIASVAHRWIARFGEADEQPILQAVLALVDVCRAAKEESLNVVLTWRAS